LYALKAETLFVRKANGDFVRLGLYCMYCIHNSSSSMSKKNSIQTVRESAKVKKKMDKKSSKAIKHWKCVLQKKATGLGYPRDTS